VHIQELKYNLYLVNFKEIEQEILRSLKLELDRYGIHTYEDLPKADYNNLLKYFTLQTLCKVYNSFAHKKNTIMMVECKNTDYNILKFLKDVKKYFPFLLYFTEDTYNMQDPAVYTELTYKLKEFRYSLDYSEYSYKKIKTFCKTNKLEALITDFKL